MSTEVRDVEFKGVCRSVWDKLRESEDKCLFHAVSGICFWLDNSNVGHVSFDAMNLESGYIMALYDGTVVGRNKNGMFFRCEGLRGISEHVTSEYFCALPNGLYIVKDEHTGQYFFVREIGSAVKYGIKNLSWSASYTEEQVSNGEYPFWVSVYAYDMLRGSVPADGRSWFEVFKNMKDHARIVGTSIVSVPMLIGVVGDTFTEEKLWSVVSSNT